MDILSFLFLLLVCFVGCVINSPEDKTENEKTANPVKNSSNIKGRRPRQNRSSSSNSSFKKSRPSSTTKNSDDGSSQKSDVTQSKPVVNTPAKTTKTSDDTFKNSDNGSSQKSDVTNSKPVVNTPANEAPTKVAERTIFAEYDCELLRNPLPCRRGKKCNAEYKCRRSCDACGMTCKGSVYRGENPNDGELFFHPKCTKLPLKIRTDEDGVILTLTNEGPSKCSCCNKHLLKGANKKIPGWCYVSNCKEGYSFHVKCLVDKAKEQNHSIGSGGGGGSGGDDDMSPSEMSSALQGVNLGVLSKHKGSTKGKSKWVKIMKIVLNTVFSILFGDPTTLLITAVSQML